jgi:4-hydroxy-2-oxoheptanedioate aldolase
MSKESLKARLKRGDVVLGPWCVMPSPQMIEIIAQAGFDYVIVDLEHGPASFETAQDMVRAAQAQGAHAMVRLGQIDEGAILKSLDIGSDGVLVAHVESGEHAREVVALSRYFPQGRRGFSPFTRAGGYCGGDIPAHAARQNEAVLTGVILEGKAGIESIDAVLAVENLDLVYIGAYDLSQALGIPGQVGHPLVREHLTLCVRKIRDAGLAAGGFVARNREDMAWMVDIGMQFVTYLPDVAAVHACFARAADEFRAVLKR